MIEQWICGFVGEGSSDNALTGPLEALLRRICPGDDVSVRPHSWLGEKQKPGKTVSGRLKDLENAGYDLCFYHRDADDPQGMNSRLAEFASVPAPDWIVPVIPVVETETWAMAALWDDKVFSTWIRDKYSIASIARLEELHNPKEILRQYLSTHSTSRRRRDFNFSAERERLLCNLDIEGPIAKFGAWQALEQRLSEAVSKRRPYLQR